MRRPLFESIFRSSDSDEAIVIEYPSDLPSPEKDYESKQIRATLQKAQRKLSPKLRGVIILKEMEGLSYEEIADALNVSVGTVKIKDFEGKGRTEDPAERFYGTKMKFGSSNNHKLRSNRNHKEQMNGR